MKRTKTKTIWIASIKLIHLVQISPPWVLQACRLNWNRWSWRIFDLWFVDLIFSETWWFLMLMEECLGLWDMTRLARIHVARYEDHITKLEEPLDLQRLLRQHAEFSPPKTSGQRAENSCSLRKLTQLRSKSPPKSPSRSQASARFFGEKLAEIQRDAWVWLRFCFQFCRRNPPFYHVARWCLMGFLTCAQSFSVRWAQKLYIYILKNMIRKGGKQNLQGTREPQCAYIPSLELRGFAGSCDFLWKLFDFQPGKAAESGISTQRCTGKGLVCLCHVWIVPLMTFFSVMLCLFFWEGFS